MFRFGGKSRRLWRPLIGLVVAYAVAAQSLLLALGGFAIPARGDENAPVAFELCLHDAQGTPDWPAGGTSHPACSHCIFCFAGAHHAVVASPPVLSHYVRMEITAALWTADRPVLPRIAAYSIASPRGPPLIG